MTHKGKVIGYILVNSVDQNPTRQLDGMKTDKTFIDKVSGKTIKRPQLGDISTLSLQMGNFNCTDD